MKFINSKWSKWNGLFAGLILLAAQNALGADNVSANGTYQMHPKFWEHVRELVTGCEKPGVKCAELEAQGNQAHFQLYGEEFYATLEDSALSDEGDLDDVYVKNAAGEVVAYRTNVPAFGDILLALVGGEHELQAQTNP